jgi:hypothetical protein
MGRYAVGMIGQKGLPALRRWLPSPRHVFCHGGLPDIDTKLEQFAMDPRCSPKRVRDAHVANELANVLRCQLDLKIDIDQILEMLSQQIEIPHRPLWQAVIRDHDRSLFGIAQTGDGDRRHFGHAESLGGLESTMTGKKGCRLVDQDWVGPNQIDAFHQAGDLAFGMSPRVARERL